MSDRPQTPVPVDDRTMISRSTDLMVAPVRDETIMLDIEKDRYYGLDVIGTDIWRRLDKPRSFAELVDMLAADYDADRVTIAEDVRVLVSLMAAHNVVRLD